MEVSDEVVKFILSDFDLPLRRYFYSVKKLRILARGDFLVKMVIKERRRYLYDGALFRRRRLIFRLFYRERVEKFNEMVDDIDTSASSHHDNTTQTCYSVATTCISIYLSYHLEVLIRFNKSVRLSRSDVAVVQGA